MCTTPWCYGDCDQCIRDAKQEKEFEEIQKECPHKKECNIITVHVKQDRCTNCNYVYNYP
jgi:hypothetical protein